MILDQRGGVFFGLDDLEELWPPDVARETWKQVVMGTPARYGLDSTGHRVATPLGGHTMGWDDLVPASRWPDVLQAARSVAKSRG